VDWHSTTDDPAKQEVTSMDGHDTREHKLDSKIDPTNCAICVFEAQAPAVKQLKQQQQMKVLGWVLFALLILCIVWAVSHKEPDYDIPTDTNCPGMTYC
jgi:hypothetical protein